MSVAEVVDAFPQKSALVVGDICLDRWCKYDPSFAEPSRETGIDRIAVVSTEVSPGGGGTVANNLAALGAGRVAVLGILGTDGFAHELIEALRLREISVDLLVRDPDLPTFTYTKLINVETGVEDKPRVDFINTREIPEATGVQLVEHLRTYAAAFDVIYVSDQAETDRGHVVTAAMRDALHDIARENPGQVIWVDSRMRGELFRNVVLKPNQQEGEAASKRMFGRIDYPGLRQSTQARSLFVTQGANGVLVVDEQGETLVPGRPLAAGPVDICGAGDSFSAGAGLALAITGSPVEAARVGNLVASITVMKAGTGTASPGEVKAAAREMGW